MIPRISGLKWKGNTCIGLYWSRVETEKPDCLIKGTEKFRSGREWRAIAAIVLLIFHTFL